MSKEESKEKIEYVGSLKASLNGVSAKITKMPFKEGTCW